MFRLPLFYQTKQIQLAHFVIWEAKDLDPALHFPMLLFDIHCLKRRNTIAEGPFCALLDSHLLKTVRNQCTVVGK